MAQFYHPTKSSDSNDFAVNMITGNKPLKRFSDPKVRKQEQNYFPLRRLALEK